MTDLVRELRDWNSDIDIGEDHVVRRAAAEIERLEIWEKAATRLRTQRGALRDALRAVLDADEARIQSVGQGPNERTAAINRCMDAFGDAHALLEDTDG